MPQEEFRWPCEQCGAQLRFAPGQTRLVCDHCGHVQEIPQETQRSRTKAAFVASDFAGRNPNRNTLSDRA